MNDFELKILEESFMQVSHLDDFHISFGLPSVTAIIPTYNRSPNTPHEDSNPLGWCLDSLLSQRGDVLNEVIVVDDASTDHTREVVSDFQAKSGIPIIYIQNPEHRGSSLSRNIAMDRSSNDLVMFVDDDSIFSRYMFFGANYTLSLLDEGVSVLHMPIYHRRTTPFPVNMDEIGQLDIEKGLILNNFDGFPVEYEEDIEGKFIDKELGILRPIRIKNLAGIFLAKKLVIQEVGGFPENLFWNNGYREETDLALRLSKQGYDLFFTPDPKFHCVHLKYGAIDEVGKGGIPEQDPRLRRLVDESNVYRTNNGNRVDSEEWFFNLIVSTYVTLGRRNLSAAQKYIERVRKTFVRDNSLEVSGVVSIDGIEKRVHIFNRAVEEGTKLIGASL